MLEVEKHIEFIKKFANDDGWTLWMTQQLRISGMYWGLNALHLLGKPEAFDRSLIIEFVMSCQLSNGSFASYPEHDGHLMNTVYACQILAIYDALDRLNVEKTAQYVASRQNADGSFSGDEWGESDARFVFGALTCLSVLKKLDLIDTEKSVNWILNCQNLDGGFGPLPGSESHGAYVLAICNKLHLIDYDHTCSWLSQRQVPNGGLNGRPAKLPDTCYSWWELSGLKLMNRIDWIDQQKLIDFILNAQDKEMGGIADREGDEPDVFHTNFAVSALSILNYPGVEPVDPLYCLPLYVTQRLGIASI